LIKETIQNIEIGKMEETIKQFNLLFEPWEDAVILITPDDTILGWNRGAQNLYGYSAESVMGKKYSLLVSSSIKDNTLNVLHKINQAAPYVCYETEHAKKDGDRIHVCLNISPIRNDLGEILAFSIVVRNMAERNQEKDLFTALTESSPIGIYIVQGGKFEYINRQFEEIIGYGINELLSTNSLHYIYEADRELTRANAVNALKSGRCQPYEYRIVAKSGQIKWILETVISIKYRGKLATLGNFMDITESKRMQEETQHANERMTAMLMKLQEQSRQHVVLTEMRDMLQACTKLEETAPIIMGAMKKLFPQSQGALFLMSNSRSDLESIVKWGGFPLDPDDNVFAPDACWGLRRGRTHVVEDLTVGPICPHLKHVPKSPYVCLPLIAKGDLLGLLHLNINVDNTGLQQQKAVADLKEIATTLSEYLSLSIANVRLSESLSKQSIQDSLSGLYNRRFMEESIQREILRAARKQNPIGIIMADLDHFKQFNDIHGHGAGDKIISQVGKILREKFRGSDIACRYGGEEFLVILSESNLEDTCKRAESVREEIKKWN